MKISKVNYVGVLVTAIFVLLTSFYPFVVLISTTTGIPNNPLSMAYRAVYMLLSIIVVLWGVVKIKQLKISLGGILLILLWLMYSVRMVYDLTIVDIRIYESDFYFYAFGIGGCFIPSTALILGIKKVNQRKLLKILFGFLCLVNLSVILQLFASYGFSMEIFATRPRITEESGHVFNPLGVSKGGAILSIFSLFFLLFKEYRLLTKYRYLLFSGAILGLANLILGASRGPLASFTVVILLMVGYKLYIGRKSLKYFANLIFAFATVSAAVVFLLLPAINSGKFELANRVLNGIDSGFGEEVRAYQWAAAWSQIKASPILGDNMVENYTYFYPHNIYIEIALSLGIIGSILFLGILLLFTGRFFLALRNGNIMLVFFFVMLAQLSFGLSGITIPTGNHFWAFLCVCLCVRFLDAENIVQRRPLTVPTSV